MFIEEMEILIECKRLVEDMLGEMQTRVEYMEKCGKDPSYLKKDIERMKMALSGKRFVNKAKEGNENEKY